MWNKMNDGDAEDFVIGVMLRLEVGLPYWCFSPDYAIPLSLVAVLLSVGTERAYRRMTGVMRRVLFMAAGGPVQTAIPVGLLIATTRYRYPESPGFFDWPKFEFMVLYGSLGCLTVGGDASAGNRAGTPGPGPGTIVRQAASLARDDRSRE